MTGSIAQKVVIFNTFDFLKLLNKTINKLEIY